MKPFCAIVDWGTSNFRFWILGGDGAVLATRKSDEGAMVADRDFASVLNAHLKTSDAPGDLPVIICGMAGSRQGWMEAPYVEAPTKLDRVIAQSVRLPDQLSGGRAVFILPGIAQTDIDRPDVMRGEETQLLGALSLSKNVQRLTCMPGTHCKWVVQDDDAVHGFTTYMTGELFAAVSAHTVLRHALLDSGVSDGVQRDVFAKAVQQAFEDPARLTARLFSIRAGQLVGGAGRETGGALLSGYLIGAELASALADHDGMSAITLIASKPMATLYSHALEIAGVEADLIDAEEACIAGLWYAAQSILQHQIARDAV